MERIKDSREIIITCSIGREGTELLVEEESELVKAHFPKAFVDLLCDGPLVREPDTRSPSEKEEIICRTAGIVDRDAYVGDVGYGGIFTALWSMTKTLGCGMEVEIGRIPVKQETIEVCELLRLNPYYLVSGAECKLIVCDHGGYLIRRLKENGIAASAAGFITWNNDKILYQGDNIRYLDRPAKDEWIRYTRKERIHERTDIKSN